MKGFTDGGLDAYSFGLPAGTHEMLACVEQRMWATKRRRASVLYCMHAVLDDYALAKEETNRNTFQLEPQRNFS